MNARAPDSTKSAAAGLGVRNRPVATNILAALTGSASGGMTIALDALGETYMRIAAEQGINPALMRCCGWPQLAPVPSTACRIMVLS